MTYSRISRAAIAHNFFTQAIANNWQDLDIEQLLLQFGFMADRTTWYFFDVPFERQYAWIEFTHPTDRSSIWTACCPDPYKQNYTVLISQPPNQYTPSRNELFHANQISHPTQGA